jgi:hypothetical protein
MISASSAPGVKESPSRGLWSQEIFGKFHAVYRSSEGAGCVLALLEREMARICGSDDRVLGRTLRALALGYNVSYSGIGLPWLCREYQPSAVHRSLLMSGWPIHIHAQARTCT